MDRNDATDAANPVLEAVTSLAPTIAARAEEIERARRLPPDLVDDLRQGGCFRALVPTSHGGAGLDLPAAMGLLETLARADGSVGWTVMIGAAAPFMFAKLPRATFDAIYAHGPDVIVGGAFNPTGVATPVPGGYQVAGRWSFASGCQHDDWFLAHCVVDDGRQPPLRMMVLPRSDVAIEDTWSVSGLCGTGSHDFAVNGAFVPEERTFAVWGPPCLDEPLAHVPELAFSTLCFASVATGIAQGALADVTALATAKVPAFAGQPLATNPLFQNELAEATAQLAAARALLRAEARAVWAEGEARRPVEPDQQARLRAATTWATRAAAEVVDTAYTAGGGSAMRLGCPLQRRFRDVHALTQHFALKADTYTLCGAVLAGQEVDLTFL